MCKDCNRYFVEQGQDWFISKEERKMIDRLLLEKLSLRGICRVVQVSLTWLMSYVNEKYATLSDELFYHLSLEKRYEKGNLYVRMIPLQADEMWTFVKKKWNKVWLWLVMEGKSQQILSFHLGSRDEQSARKVLEKIPFYIRKHALLYTDAWRAYQKVANPERHIWDEKKGLTNKLEGFNNFLRQRCSRLVRKTTAFSKKWKNHEGAIRYLIQHYNHSLSVNL